MVRIIFFSSILFLFSLFSFAEEMKQKMLEQYYLDGIYYYVDGSYTTSAEQFEALSHNYPFSKRTHNALIMEAFLNYIDNEKAKIDGIVEVFLRLFPNDPQEPYMMYLQAMGYYSQVSNEYKSFDAMQKSKQLFLELINKHPNSKYSNEAKIKIEYLDKIIQLNDVRIGELYFQRKDYIGAMKRFTGMFQQYPEIIPEIEERVLCRVVVLSKMLEMDTTALKYEKILKEKYSQTKCEF